MEESRTQNTIRNVRTGAIVQLINKIMAFIVRTVFIKMLNTEYLGINGLFSNVLTILSFAELGIGTAIIFNMYKTVADKDKEKMKSLMKLYKKAYNTIGLVVFGLGLCVIPFMGFIVKDVPNIKENINFIYILFLLNTSLSYFFSYKKSIISAHQKQSIINNIDSVFYFITSILEIIFLITTKNFIIYLIIQIMGTFLANIYISFKADRMYPFLKEKNVKKLSKEESKGIFDNVKSLVVYKFGSVIMNGTDNILISAMVNVSVVGLCSNYVMIMNSIKSVMTSALSGVTASVGNLNVVATKKRKEDVFYELTLINYLIYSFCAVAFIVLLNPFIKLWLGAEYLLGINVSIALALSFFVDGLRAPAYTYRTTLGLFQKGKATPYIGAIANIVFSIILCQFFGVTGIFFATSIAQLVSYSWIDPYLIYKYEFSTSMSKYVKKCAIYFMVFIINAVVSIFIIRLVPLRGIIGFIVDIILVCLIPNIINLIVFCKLKEFKELKEKLLTPILEKIKFARS